MAETITDVPKQENIVKQGETRPGLLTGPPVRVSWGAIFAGVVAALGVGALLHTFGFALGLSAIDPENPSSLRGSGIFTGIWSLVTAFVALFVGGLVASRGAGVLTRASGALHGLVMWGLTIMLAIFMIVSLVARVASGITSMGVSAVQSGMGAAEQAGDLAGALGIDAQTLLGPINQRLRAEGKPQVTTDQLQAATRDIANRAIREGRLDRELLTSSIAEHTQLSNADAQAIASDIERSFTEAQRRLGGTASDLQTGALQAAEQTGQAFWGVFGAMLFGLLSALFGATLGVSKRQRYWAEQMPQGAPPTP